MFCDCVGSANEPVLPVGPSTSISEMIFCVANAAVSRGPELTEQWAHVALHRAVTSKPIRMALAPAHGRQLLARAYAAPLVRPEPSLVTDATYPKVRREGRVVSMAVVIAIGVDGDG